MLPKIIFCALLAAARAIGSNGADYNQQASAVPPKFLNLPSFDTKTAIGEPVTIDHKSFIEHVTPGTGSGRGGSSHQQSTGTRSSTLLNKAIAGQGAVSDPVIQPSSYSSVQATPPNFSNDPIGISSLGYANSGILPAGLFGTPIDKAFGSSPPVISLNSRIDHSASGSIPAIPNGVPSFNNNKDDALSAGFLNAPFDKINIPVPEIISVSVSSSSDDGSLPSSPVKIPTANYINDGLLSAGQLGLALNKDVNSIPNAVPINSLIGHGALGSTSTAAVPSLPVKISSSVGPAESSFLSSVGALVEKPTTLSMPGSISLKNIAAVQNEAPSISYPAEKVFAGSVAGQSTVSNPTALTSQASIDKILSIPASDLLGHLGNGYNSNPNGILSSGFLGAPISSILGLNGKELSSNGLFSGSNIANNGNIGTGLASTPVVRNKDDTLNKFETVIQHTTPSNAANPPAFNGINNNNLFNGLIGNGIFADPLGFPNGLFGNTYNGMNGFGAGSFAGDNNIFSKYFWR